MMLQGAFDEEICLPDSLDDSSRRDVLHSQSIGKLIWGGSSINTFIKDE